MPKWMSENPGERRCVNCDQRLIADAARRHAEAQLSASPAVVNYVCPDDHERWLYNSHSREWRQMY